MICLSFCVWFQELFEYLKEISRMLHFMWEILEFLFPIVILSKQRVEECAISNVNSCSVDDRDDIFNSNKCLGVKWSLYNLLIKTADWQRDTDKTEKWNRWDDRLPDADLSSEFWMVYDSGLCYDDHGWS
jgi:hypothetical protein